jgi:hypothetical protein
MQRWIVGGLVALMLLGAGLIAYYKLVYQPNKPAPVWVPLPIRVDLEIATRDKIIEDLKTKLSDEEVLRNVSKDVGLVKKWNLPSDHDGAREIGRRLFVRAGDADTPMGKVPAIHIGVAGNSREREVSGEIAVRMMKDVWKILGIKPPPEKGSE